MPGHGAHMDRRADQFKRSVSAASRRALAGFTTNCAPSGNDRKTGGEERGGAGCQAQKTELKPSGSSTSSDLAPVESWLSIIPALAKFASSEGSPNRTSRHLLRHGRLAHPSGRLRASPATKQRPGGVNCSSRSIAVQPGLRRPARIDRSARALRRSDGRASWRAGSRARAQALRGRAALIPLFSAITRRKIYGSGPMTCAPAKWRSTTPPILARRSTISRNSCASRSSRPTAIRAARAVRGFVAGECVAEPAAVNPSTRPDW